MTTLEKAARAMISKAAECGWVGDDGNGAAKDITYVTVDCQVDFAELAAAAFSSVLLDPSDEVVEAMCRAYLAVEGLNPDERTNTGEAHWTFYRDHMRACLRAAGVKITGSQG